MTFKGRMVLIFVDHQPVSSPPQTPDLEDPLADSSSSPGSSSGGGDSQSSSLSQRQHLAQRVCVLLSRCYFPNACLVQPETRGLSSAAAQYAAAVKERDTTAGDVGKFATSSETSKVSMRVSKSQSVFLESVEMAGVRYMRLGDADDDQE
jgi:hypothetical protein